MKNRTYPKFLTRIKINNSETNHNISLTIKIIRIRNLLSFIRHFLLHLHIYFTSIFHSIMLFIITVFDDTVSTK